MLCVVLGFFSSNAEAAYQTQIKGPFYKVFIGSELDTWAAKHSSPSLTLSAAGRKAAIAKYGKIIPDIHYKIKWYQKIQYSPYGLSYRGTIVDYSCVW
ncbi:hypothetical protein B7C51_07910 [Paenibacillus larvae subsp. pulvifaciens]|uniref:Uncharacterized protein n=1 Tax=Paenibacillus larvae subsp. pulvifaciens TaxID=1477 RepID=A0A1V0UR69_9BACL|nr:hypothetical protein BXP28_01220 [Paenibacillus larvae subsp. larvae]ARF67773.1 hypothetical protein B7C51_07910 [Paenibacillus larvae subsp. pulvifaciens]ETK26349.1 hypothetical protein ERIC1_2c05470 [Paenibacillus larvae subsp. larvae DSM 25719]